MQVSEEDCTTLPSSSASVVEDEGTTTLSRKDDNDNNKDTNRYDPHKGTVVDSSAVVTKGVKKSSGNDSGWMETKPKTGTTKQKAPVPELPLDWTRVKRRRTKAGDIDDEDCCPPIVATLDEENLGPHQELVRGVGVFCLHDSDPSWFQGYFFPNVGTAPQSTSAGQQHQQEEEEEDMLASSNNSNDHNSDGDNNDEHEPSSFLKRQKPWGLLASQEELDDCLRCADGGYRRITLAVFSFRLPDKKKTEKLVNIEWTGGDMMRLLGERASFEPHRLLTGTQAVPHVERLFGSLLQKCRKNLDEEPGQSCSVLDLLPDVAVISGPMKLVVSKKKDDEDDDWLG